MGLFKEKSVFYEDDTTIRVEKTLDKLNKQARLLDGRSQSLTNFTPSVSRLLHSQIDKLKSSNFKMQKQLSSESCQVARLTEVHTGTGDDSFRKDQTDTQDEVLTLKTQENVEKIQQLERSVEEFHFGIMERRKASGGVYADRERRDKLTKQTNLLDGRLHRARLDFNRRQTANREMREMIASMRAERLGVDRQIRHMLRQVDQVVSDVSTVVEQAMHYADGRDASTREVAELKRAGNREHRQFQEQWRDLGRLVSYNLKIIGHIENLGDKRLIKEKEKWAKAQEYEMRKILTAGAWDIAKDKACIKATSQRVAVYDNLFRRLEKATGVDGIHALVAVFEDSEDRNFRQFQTVNSLSDEIEELESGVALIKAESEIIEDAKRHGDGGVVVDGEFREKLVSHTVVQTLNERIDRTQRALDDLNEVRGDQARTVLNLRVGIGKILLLFGESDDPLATMPVTESTLTAHLSFLEDMVRQMLMYSMNEQNRDISAIHVRMDVDISAAEEGGADPIAGAIPHVVPPTLMRTTDPTVGKYESFSDEDDYDDDDPAPFLTMASRRK